MALRQLLKRWFSGPGNSADETYDDAQSATSDAVTPPTDTAVQGDRLPTEVAVATVVQNPSNDAGNIPNWLIDEGLLRDEAVLFGLSGAKVDEKVATIRHHFAIQAAPLEKTVEQHNEKIGELNLTIEQHENLIGEWQIKLTDLAARQPQDHQLPRRIVGLVLAVAMGVGNFFLIDETLRPVFGQNHWPAVGVFLAGMFGLFSRLSLLHDDEAPTTFRRVLEEVGLPAAAALFVFAQALPRQSWLGAIALLVFTFFLFLIAGKLLLSTLTVLRADWMQYVANRRLRREQGQKQDEGDADMAEHRAAIDRLRVEKWQIIPQLNRAEADLNRLNARRDMLQKLFESEYALARTLTDRQRQKLLNDRVIE